MSKKNMVVHIITSSDIGGAQKHLQDIVTNLDKKFFRPVVICGVGGDFDNSLSQLGIETYKLEALDKKIDIVSDLKVLFSIIKLLKRLRPVIVHTHSSKAGLLGRIAAKLCRIPVIIFTAHGFVFHDYMSKSKYAFYLLLEKLAGLITDQIIAVSELDKSKAIINKIIAREKIETVHNGIDVELFSPEESFNLSKVKDEFGISSKDITIGLIGRLVEEKGLPYFIEAAELVTRNLPNCKFLLIGDGPLKSSLKSIVEAKNLSNNFIFTGVREDVKVILSVLDVVTFSSIKEGLPIALLEAMAMEKAVVSTTAGGIPEVIDSGRNGLLVPVGNSGLLAEGIQTLINNPDMRKELGKAARSTIKRSFSLSQMVSKTQKLYFDLLKRKKII